MSDPKPNDQLDHATSRAGDIRSEGYVSHEVTRAPRTERFDSTAPTMNDRSESITQQSVNDPHGAQGGRVGGGYNYMRQPIIRNTGTNAHSPRRRDRSYCRP